MNKPKGVASEFTDLTYLQTLLKLEEKIDKIENSGGTTTTIPDGSVTTNKLANSSVTNTKIKDDSISTNKVQNGAITGDKIAPNTVDDSNISNISTDKLTNAKAKNNQVLMYDGNKFTPQDIEEVPFYNHTDGGKVLTVKVLDETSYEAQWEELKVKPDIPNRSIEGLQLKTGTITNNEMAADSIDTNNIKNYSITNNKLGVNCVTNANIADNSISVNKLTDLPTTTIKPNSITTEMLQDNCVTNLKLQDNSVGNTKIIANSIYENHIYPQAVTYKCLRDLSVGNSKIQNKTITGNKIADSTITSDKIAPTGGNAGQVLGNIDGVKIGWVDQTGGSAVIKPNSITTEMLQDNCVTNVKINDFSITTNKLANNAVNAVKLAPNSVTATHIGSGAVTTEKINSAGLDPKVISTTTATEGQVLTNKNNEVSWSDVPVPTNIPASNISNAPNDWMVVSTPDSALSKNITYSKLTPRYFSRATSTDYNSFIIFDKDGVPDYGRINKLDLFNQVGYDKIAGNAGCMIIGGNHRFIFNLDETTGLLKATYTFKISHKSYPITLLRSVYIKDYKTYTFPLLVKDNKGNYIESSQIHETTVSNVTSFEDSVTIDYYLPNDGVVKPGDTVTIVPFVGIASIKVLF